MLDSWKTLNFKEAVMLGVGGEREKEREYLVSV
jgi:hypothetical protein